MNAAVFHQAVADGDATKVKFLINIGQQARVNQLNKQGYTSLQQSCKDGRIDVVNVLLNHGANTSAVGRKGRSALHLASAGGYPDIVELLITSCADLSAKDDEGNLPVDVAKTEEIAKLLSSAEAEKKAKSAEANKKSTSEEWSQNFKSLPAGSRNSLVSNSSSDSGVFTEDATSARSVDNSRCTRNGFNRGQVCDSRAMGVLNEWEEVHERNYFNAQTTMKTVKAEPKLRRSMSERLPARQRKRSFGRRDISDELSALNLSRALARQPREVTTNEYYYDQRNELRDCGNNDCSTSIIESPNEDLGYGADIQDDGEPGRSSMRKFFENNPKTLRKNQNESMVCYVGGDEGWEEGDEGLESKSPLVQARREDRFREGSSYDELDLYRRSQPRNLRGARRRTVDVCNHEISHEEDRYLAASDGGYQFINNGRLQSTARTGRPRSARGNETIASRGFDDSYLDTTRGSTLTRNGSACSDTAIGKYYERRMQMSDHEQYYHVQRHYDYNSNQEYCDQNIYRDPCNNLPGYEETIRRFSNERLSRRPASRQVSEV